MTPQLIQPPVGEPLSLAEAKTHLRVDDGEDDLIASLIAAARGHCEALTGRQLLTASYRVSLDAAPRGREIRLPRPVLQSVESIRYTAPDGTSVVMDPDDYDIDTAAEPARVVAVRGWPAVSTSRLGAFRVEYTAGYGDAAAVPDAIKHAMRLLIGHWYANREEVIVGSFSGRAPMASQALLSPYIVYDPEPR